MPIGFFFTALAQEAQDHAIGIVLSGTDFDGTQGIKAIKAEGGITFAQDQETAKYYSMPQSASQTECVDFILPPKGMAKTLKELGEISIWPPEKPPSFSRPTTPRSLN